MKQIEVISRDFGFWTQEDINLQRFETEDGEKHLLWCNHASTETEHDTVEQYQPDGPDLVSHVTYEVCQRCPAYRQVEEDWTSEWYESPPEGIN